MMTNPVQWRGDAAICRTLTVVNDSNPAEFTNDDAISRNSFSLSVSSSKKSSGTIAFGSDGLFLSPPLELLLNRTLCILLILPRPTPVLVLCFQNDVHDAAALVEDDRAMLATNCLRIIRATDDDITGRLFAQISMDDLFKVFFWQQLAPKMTTVATDGEKL